MFTGIVEETGVVDALTRTGADARLTVRAEVVLDGTRPGDSIAVDGVCLTVTEVADATFSADVVPETLARSALGRVGPGSRVNLERAVPVAGRLDGHLVQGHVDGVGTLAAREPGERWEDLRVTCDRSLLRLVAEKGSIAVSGVSLTVTAADDDGFGVSLVPTTLARTTLGDLAVGDPVNLEVDVVARYVARLLATRGWDR